MRHEPRLLLVTTAWWPSLGVLASTLEQAGFAVTMLCPRGHVAMSAVRFTARELDRRRPGASLLSALDAMTPDLVVAGDERVVDLLRDLYRDGPAQWRPVIEAAIGRPESHGLLTGRPALLQAAAAVGFTVPETQALTTAEAVDGWLARVPPPWVLKLDGAWGGEGVRITSDAAACRAAFHVLRRGPSRTLALYRKWVNHDPALWRDRQSGRAGAVSMQAYVPGRPASCAVFVAGTEVLGAAMIEASTTCGDLGPSTLVRAIDRPEVIAAIGALVARHGLSGFLGFDFMIDARGTAHLIEMNPRITMPSRMTGPFGTSPIAAAARHWGAVPRGPAAPDRTVFASFPLAWLADPHAPALAACRDDVPWREPAMLRDSLRPLWPERGLLAALPSRLRRWRAVLRGERRPPDYRRCSVRWWRGQGGLDDRDGAGSATPLPVRRGVATPLSPVGPSPDKA